MSHVLMSSAKRVFQILSLQLIQFKWQSNISLELLKNNEIMSEVGFKFWY